MNECVMACEPSKLEMMIRRAKNVLLQLAYLLRLKKRPKGNTVRHAEREFVAAGYTPLDQEQEDGPNKWIQENVLELLEVFARQGAQRILRALRRGDVPQAGTA